MSVLKKLLVFALPVIQATFFCLVIGLDTQKINLAIVNGEMNNTETCYWKQGCYFVNLGCRFLEFLDHSYTKTFYTNLEKAKDSIRLGKSLAALYMTENFTDAYVARAALGSDADEETIDQSEIKVWFDISNEQNKQTLSDDLKVAYGRFQKDILEQCGENEYLRVEFQNPISFYILHFYKNSDASS